MSQIFVISPSTISTDIKDYVDDSVAALRYRLLNSINCKLNTIDVDNLIVEQEIKVQNSTTVDPLVEIGNNNQISDFNSGVYSRFSGGFIGLLHRPANDQFELIKQGSEPDTLGSFSGYTNLKLQNLTALGNISMGGVFSCTSTGSFGGSVTIGGNAPLILQNGPVNTRLTSLLTSSRSIAIPNLTQDDILLTNTSASTVTNKSFIDNSTLLWNSVDNSKRVQFSLSLLSVPSTRVFSFPDGSDTLVGTTLQQDLYNKRLFSPTISTILNGSATITLPTLTSTLATLSLAETFLNKTISAGTLSGVTISTGLLHTNSQLKKKLICFWGDTNQDAHNYYGFGLTSNTLNYMVDGTGASHVFYCANSASTSNELFRINNTNITASKPMIITPFTSQGIVHNNASGLLSTSLIVDGDISNLTISNGKLATVSSANNANYIVARDASGNFSAGSITANITGSSSLNVLKTGDTMTGLLTCNLGLYVTKNTAADASIVEFRHSNQTQGIGFTYSKIFATGTNANQDLSFESRGTGNLIWNSNTTVAAGKTLTMSSTGSINYGDSLHCFQGGGVYADTWFNFKFKVGATNGNNWHVDTTAGSEVFAIQNNTVTGGTLVKTFHNTLDNGSGAMNLVGNLTIAPLTTANGVLKNSTGGLISSSLIVDANITTNTIANNKLVAEPVSTNTANRIVLRDASGGFVCGAITAGRSTIDADYTPGGLAQQLIIRGVGLNSGKRMLLSYDTSDNAGTIQTEDQGNSSTTLFINPAGGGVQIGAVEKTGLRNGLYSKYIITSSLYYI